MDFELEPLPYAIDALEPHISAATVETHYTKHHQSYMDKVKHTLTGKPAAEKSLTEIVRTATGDLFNNAAQVWNHNFYWKSLKPGGTVPNAEIRDDLIKHFGSVDNFRQQFAETAKGKFGSGWTWLVKDGVGRMRVISTSDAENPLVETTPLLTLDVWEHAYYLDYRNERGKYVENFLEHLVNWDFVAENLHRAPTS